MTADIPAGAFTPSTATLEPSDPRGALVAALDADCKRLRELCWGMRQIANDYDLARSAAATANINGTQVDIDGLVAATTAFNRRELEITQLAQDIDRRAADYNFGRKYNERICISHTEEGLPIRVAKSCHKPLWGI